MAIRRRSYRLDQEPDTGAPRLIPAEQAGPGPQQPHEEHEEHQEHEEYEDALDSVVARIAGAGTELSYSLLPDGARLLCAALPGQRVEALHVSADTPGPGPVWPIDTWGSDAWEPDAGDTLGAGFVESELPLAEPHLDHSVLVEFARAHADRVAPFLTDVRRLFGDPAGRQIVLVEEEPGTVARWIALACASLPEAYVPALTFTTWTADPYRAPQHIIGTGPGAAFDRSDEATTAYLYRVYDGTGGPQSPPPDEPDAWARLTAERWLAGNPPRPAPGAATHPEGPFALLPLVAGAGRKDPGDGGASALSGAELAGLSGESLHVVFDALAQTVHRGEAAPHTLDGLDRLCRGLDGDQALAARPLALALVKHRLDASRGHGTLPDLTAFDGLPLGQDAWRELREEYGERADDALRARLRGPVTGWTEPLRLALAVGADGGPGLAEAMDRLAGALLHPEGRECAQAVRVLTEVDHTAFTRRVLRLLLVDFTVRKLDRLRALARSPQGEWLRRNIEDAPLTVRLAAAAAYLSDAPDHLRGAQLFDRLTELLSGPKVEDVTTLRLLWHIVWRNDPPDPADQAWVARACTPRLIIDADLGRRIMGWLKEPDRCDRELVDFAREMREDGKLGAHERNTARLLVAAQDLLDGRLPLSKAGIDLLEELGRKAPPLGPVLRRGIEERVGRALAGANPLDMCEAHGLRILVAAGPELLNTYRAHLLDPAQVDRMVRELPDKPSELAAYFFLWRPRRRHGVTPQWRTVADELLTHALEPVLERLDHRRLGQVATVLEREGQGLQEWTAWRHQVAGRQS
ncbi:GTPase-associated protein 1-related protein [Streptomyces sp. NPDC005863]|uniref:GTPase-associated protein 1-related protein n=1 Tax=unclassified Streptomyces TaxID=2593676 RepID=UPI00340E3996